VPAQGGQGLGALALDRAFGNAQGRGRGGDVGVLDVAQHDHRALSRRQEADGVQDPSAAQLSEQAKDGQLLVRVRRRDASFYAAMKK